MVTQHGRPPLYGPETREGDDDDDAMGQRRRVPPLRLRMDGINDNGNGFRHRPRQNLASPSPSSTSHHPNSMRNAPYSSRMGPQQNTHHLYSTATATTNTPLRHEDLDNQSHVADATYSQNNISMHSSSHPKTSFSPGGQENGDREASWPLPMADTAQSAQTAPRMRPSRPVLRPSMSASSLSGRQRSPLPERQYSDNGLNNRPLPRFPHRFTPELMQYHDPLRSSQNSGQTFSSYEQMSSTERSSILTKSSSITDMSPDTPNGYFGEDEDMTVEDAIGMYLDDIVDLPEESTSTQAAISVGELDAIAENVSEPVKHVSANSFISRSESSATDQLPSEQTQHVPPLPKDDLAEEFHADNAQKAAEDSNESPGRHQDIEPSRLTGSTQSKMEPAELEDAETTSTGKPFSEQQPSQNLSIDTSVTKTNADKPANQPIPSPRYSTLVRVAGKVPPAFLPGTDDRDRYGFRKANHHISRGQFEAWNKPYATFAENRRLKWVKLLESSGLPIDSPSTFPPKSNLLKRYIRKGIPSEYRGAAWFYYAGGYQHMHAHPGHYATLVQEAMSSSINTDKEHIERDLYRTFPDNVHFKPDMPDDLASTENNPSKSYSVIVETQMIRSLRRVLYAYALHNPRVGYTQSLNFITGMLLLFLPEEKAFWMLHIVTTELLPATHEISLEGANVDMWILMVLLRDNLPNVYTKLVSSTPTVAKTKAPALTVNMRLPDITLGLTNWLMSMFIGSLPFETTLRVWDCLFYEGSKTFFRVALGIFKAGEREILSVSDPMEVFQIVQTIPKRLLDANALLEEGLSRKYRVGQGRIDALREERREAVRQEKTRLSLFTSKSLGVERPATRTGSRSPLPRLDGWRSVKKNMIS